jgi:hypothetical protein
MGVSRGRWRALLTVSLPAGAAAVLVLAGALEVWVRVSWGVAQGNPGLLSVRCDPRSATGGRLRRWFAGVPVHINSLELRDPRDYDLKKRSNTFRILVLGDSVTFGHVRYTSIPTRI